MSVLPITNIINVTIATPPVGLSEYKVNNLLYCTKEVPAVSGGIGTYAIYLSPAAVADDWGVDSETYDAAVAVFSQSPNILTGGGSFIVHPMGSGDTLTEAIATMDALIFFGGVIWGGYAPTDDEVVNASNAMQALGRMLGACDYLTTALDEGGLFDRINDASNTSTRMFLYTLGVQDARIAMAAYMSGLMSTDFSGSLTTATRNLKQLITIPVDTGITQTIANTCDTVGVDIYPSIAGLPKVISYGGNEFSDQVYGLMWLKFALQVAGFNALATTSTKVPQTEPGMATLKNAYMNVLQQSVFNGFVAPGQWNSPDLFGNPELLRTNVLSQGWYIYSAPVNSQSQAQRETRVAPLVQIAVKLAGAIHKSNVVVFVNP